MAQSALFSVLGVLATIESALPGEFLLRGKPAQFLLAFSTCSVVVNIIVTTLICGRLFVAHRTMRNVFSSEFTRAYTGVAAIVIESALPYTILGITSIILQAKNEPTDIALACVWGSFAVHLISCQKLQRCTDLSHTADSFSTHHFEGCHGSCLVRINDKSGHFGSSQQDHKFWQYNGWRT